MVVAQLTHAFPFDPHASNFLSLWHGHLIG